MDETCQNATATDEADAEPSICDSCGYEGRPVKRYSARIKPMQENHRELCDLCASTFFGNLTQYYNQYDASVVRLAQATAQGFNYLLDAIEAQAKKQEG